MEPHFRFCTSADGARLAYAVYGSGPPLMYARSHWVGMHALFPWPEARAFLDALATRTRLVTFDQRGTGASARTVDDLSVEAEAQDIAAVADAAGFDRFTLYAESGALGSCALYATAYQTRIDRLVVWHSLPANTTLREEARLCRQDWSYLRRVRAGVFYPDGPVSLQRAYSRAMKDTLSAETGARYLEMFAELDYDALLPAVSAPTLVLTRHQIAALRESALRLAGLLPNSELRFVTGNDATPFPNHEPIVEAIFEFMGLGEAQREARSGRSTSGTAIIFFADIADSTGLTERLGDAAFRAKGRELDQALRAIIGERGGTAIDGKLLGDGVLATFSGASQAIEASLRCGTEGQARGLPLHLGLHAGDLIREENNVYGGAVNIASRISGLSAPGEVLVSNTVRELARTSAGVTFEDRGEQQLKGVGDAVRLFAVRPSEER